MQVKTRARPFAAARIAFCIAGANLLSACTGSDAQKVLDNSPPQLQDDNQALAPCLTVVAHRAAGCSPA